MGHDADAVANQRRHFLAPVHPGDKGREAVSLAAAVRMLAELNHWPPGSACLHLAPMVEAGRLVVVELDGMGQAVDAEQCVWLPAALVPPRSEWLADVAEDWLDRAPGDRSQRGARPAAVIEPARPAIVGRSGIVQTLGRMASEPVLLEIAAKGARGYCRMGLLLDEVLATSTDAVRGAPLAASKLPAALERRRPGDAWTAEQQGALLACFSAGKKTDPGRSSESLQEELGAALSCSASNIKQQLSKARKSIRHQGGGIVRRAA